MGTLKMGDGFDESKHQELIEQQRLEALLRITEEHDKEVQKLKSQLEQAVGKASKSGTLVKELENELKILRAQNPERMKKQIKRLQEQNRSILTENTASKNKIKQLQKQLDTAKLEAEKQEAEEKKTEKKDECEAEMA